MLTLYQFAISHYCEKARWALDYKRLTHDRKNLLPGPHLSQTKRLGVKTGATPILDHDGTLIQGSDEIITYLDKTFADRPLTPEDDGLQEHCLQWEGYLDREVGVHVRRYFYHYLLEEPSLVIPLFTQGGPWYGPLIYRVIFPGLRSKMRKFMDISEETAVESRRRFEAAIDRINAHLRDQQFLVGNRFTRADLTAAALFAPFVQPRAYGLEWPADLPGELHQAVQTNLPRLAWVGTMYERYR